MRSRERKKLRFQEDRKVDENKLKENGTKKGKGEEKRSR